MCVSASYYPREQQNKRGRRLKSSSVLHDTKTRVRSPGPRKAGGNNNNKRKQKKRGETETQRNCAACKAPNLPIAEICLDVSLNKSRETLNSLAICWIVCESWIYCRCFCWAKLIVVRPTELAFKLVYEWVVAAASAWSLTQWLNSRFAGARYSTISSYTVVLSIFVRLLLLPASELSLASSSTLLCLEKVSLSILNWKSEEQAR